MRGHSKLKGIRAEQEPVRKDEFKGITVVLHCECVVMASTDMTLWVANNILILFCVTF